MGGTSLEEIEGRGHLSLEDLSAERAIPGAKPPKKMRYSHAAMIDLILSRPWISQNEIAQHFGYTASWISTIMSSDSWKVQYSKRMEEVVDPILRANVEQNFQAMVLRSQELLLEKLNKDNPSDNLVLRALDLSSRAAGYGARAETPAPVDATNVEAHLEVMAKGLTTLLRRKRQDESVEGEIVSE